MLNFDYTLLNYPKVIQTFLRKSQGLTGQGLDFIMEDGTFEAGIGLMGRLGAQNHLQQMASKQVLNK